MSSERINGARINLEACTQEELTNMLGSIGDRLLATQGEYLTVYEVLTRRFSEPEVSEEGSY